MPPSPLSFLFSRFLVHLHATILPTPSPSTPLCLHPSFSSRPCLSAVPRFYSPPCPALVAMGTHHQTRASQTAYSAASGASGTESPQLQWRQAVWKGMRRGCLMSALVLTSIGLEGGRGVGEDPGAEGGGWSRGQAAEGIGELRGKSERGTPGHTKPSAAVFVALDVEAGHLRCFGGCWGWARERW